MKTASLLPNKLPSHHSTVAGRFGSFEVVWCEDLDTHVLIFVQGAGRYAGSRGVIASHHNGHSCRELATRIVAAWVDIAARKKAVEQAQYVIDCGGTSRALAAIAAIADPETWQG